MTTLEFNERRADHFEETKKKIIYIKNTLNKHHIHSMHSCKNNVTQDLFFINKSDKVSVHIISTTFVTLFILYETIKIHMHCQIENS